MREATGISIWLAGDCDHSDSEGAAAWLRANCQIVDQSASPGAIVLFQSRPSSVSIRQVESLHRRAPLARLILLSGPFCDGPQRSQPIPGVTRIRWHQWRQRLPLELDVARPRLPRTATDGERLDQDLRGLALGFASGTMVGIRSQRRECFQSLADACHALGLSSSWHNEVERPADVLLINGWASDLTVPQTSQPPRILLLDFPRPEDSQRAADLGFAAVLAQPLMLADLAAALDALHLPSRAADSRVA
jgi:hypothetical protein